MKTKPRIFVSVPDNRHLNERRIGIKEKVIRKIADAGYQLCGFEPEQFGIDGMNANLLNWNLESARELMHKCDAAFVFALGRTFQSKIDFTRYQNEFEGLSAIQIRALKELIISGNKKAAASVADVDLGRLERWCGENSLFAKSLTRLKSAIDDEIDSSGRLVTPVPTPYNHLEGALAVAEGLPLLIFREEGMETTGILHFGGGIKNIAIPESLDESWVETKSFKDGLNWFKQEIEKRRDVFLGYCSKANAIAESIRTHLLEQDFSVLDWAKDFTVAGDYILQEIERAASKCRCAIFLFTKDDPVLGRANAEAVPRGNVLLEVGYFIQARSKYRVAVVKEEGVEMPADLGGIIYISWENENDLSGVQERLSRFLEEAIKKQ